MDIRLSLDEIVAITKYTQPNRQVEELREQGFWRARLDREGKALLERDHYVAVCRGAVQASALPAEGPRFRPGSPR